MDEGSDEKDDDDKNDDDLYDYHTGPCLGEENARHFFYKMSRS